MAVIIVKDFPDEVRNKFKAVCAEKGITMKEGLLNLMKEAIEKARKGKS